jgi:hypothetical protein
MSSSRTLSRCVVTLEKGTQEQLDSVAPGIEVLFDDLEKGGRRFVSPAAPGFVQPKVASDKRGDETCRVEFLCTPPLTRGQTQNLVLRVVDLLAPLQLGDVPDITPHALPVQDTDPGEGRRPDDVPTRPHVQTATRRPGEAKTRPEGVSDVASRKVTEDGDAPGEEVTTPRSRDEMPTKPQGVFAIKRPRKD